MKKFYKITIACFIVGLVLMGVGAAMLLLGINSFTYMGDKNTKSGEELTKSVELKLPDNLAKIYDYSYDSNYELVVDDNLDGNNAVLDITYSSNWNVDVYPEFMENCYLYNNFTENYSKYPVNYFTIAWDSQNVNDKSDFEEFKEILGDFKEKKVYNYNNYASDIKLTLRVSEDGYERFAKLPDGYELYSYNDYMAAMQEREEEQEADCYEITDED